MNFDEAARRYVLGLSEDAEAQRLEEEYFRDPDASDRIALIEEQLIEEYLDSRLPAADREAFEESYLATAGHRIRVETVRRLRRRAPARLPAWPWLALAAALFVMIAGAAWLLAPGRNTTTTTAGGTSIPPAVAPNAQPPAPAPAAPPPPTVFALSLPQLGVRGGSSPPAHVVPAGTDLVSLNLEGDSPADVLVDARVIVETIEGNRVWTGAARAGERPSEGILARVEIPAGVLRPNDYIVRLLARGGSARAREIGRYFLRIR